MFSKIKNSSRNIVEKPSILNEYVFGVVFVSAVSLGNFNLKMRKVDALQ